MKNSQNKFPTLRNIREAHNPRRNYVRYLPLARFVFYPIAFSLTWLAIRIKLTTENVAWLSGIVGIVGCLILVSDLDNFLPLGIGLLLFFNLLDGVDGSIARTMKTQSPYGRFLDSICGGIIDFAFWAVLGIMAFRNPQYLIWSRPFGFPKIFWLLIGGATCFFSIWMIYLERLFDELLRPFWERLNGSKHNDRSSISIKETIPHWSIEFHFFRVINHNLRVRETHYLLLIITFIFRAIDSLLYFYLCYYLLYSILLMIIYSIRGVKIKNNFNKFHN